MTTRRWATDKGCGWLVGVVLLGLMGIVRPLPAAEFACGGGDVACLISAIHAANANGTANTITLAAGMYTLAAVDNDTDGPTGLPSVTGSLTITGAGANATVIERAVEAPQFRLLHVAARGVLTLDGLTLQGGNLAGLPDGGGGVRNHGTLTLTHGLLRGHAASDGGGIHNTGTLMITHSTVSGNVATGGASDVPAGGYGGGIYIAGGTGLTITHSTLSGNVASGGGGLYLSFAPLTITNSTLYGNMAGGNGGGVFSAGWSGATLINSTVAGNTATQGGGVSGGGGPGIGAVTRQNTIVAWNWVPPTGMGPDCYGPQFSLGHNLTGDSTGCAITATDLTGDPNFGAYTETGVPGQGYVPLYPTSPAIDAGDPATCPPTDQLGQARVGPCDIGAIEFQPETVLIHRAIFADSLARLFVSAVTSAPPDAVLVATVAGCLANEPMSHLGSRYVLLRDVETCGDLNGQMVTVTSTYGGSASAPLR
jgi:hypothetical protein